MKVCTQCEIQKESLEFPKRLANKDGLYSWCKECCRKKTREHAIKNPEKVKASIEKRKDKQLASARLYKKLNKDRLVAKQKIYYQANRDMLCEKAKKYGKNKSPEQKQERREYYLKWKESDSGKQYLKENWKERKKKYRKHYKASEKVKDAIKAGKLVRPETCSICNEKGRIEGHHADYDKPLEVIWVCKKCHTMIHKNLKKEY